MLELRRLATKRQASISMWWNGAADPEKFIRARRSGAPGEPRVMIPTKRTKRAMWWLCPIINCVRRWECGVNVRLAEELTGWTLEVHSEEEN